MISREGFDLERLIRAAEPHKGGQQAFMVYETDRKLHTCCLGFAPTCGVALSTWGADAQFIELLSIAYDASFAHMYEPGTSRHIKRVLRIGATLEEIMEVRKLCVAAGIRNNLK